MTWMRPIWVRREVYCWDWYEWDAWTRFCSDMTETPSLPLTLIWLRRLDPILHRYDWDAQKKFVLAFRFFTLETATQSKIKIKKLGRLSHINVNGKLGVSVISLQNLVQSSHSYRSRLDWFGAVILGIPYLSHKVELKKFWVTYDDSYEYFHLYIIIT